MPHYVCLVSFTEQGLANLGTTTKRAEAFEDTVKELGVEIKYTLWTVGRYDIVHILEAPDDDTAASLAFSLGALGNVRTETLRGFTRKEMNNVLEKVQTPYDLLKGMMK